VITLKYFVKIIVIEVDFYKVIIHLLWFLLYRFTCRSNCRRISSTRAAFICCCVCWSRFWRLLAKCLYAWVYQ